MKVHNLKTINPYFQDVWCGLKQFDIRKDDRQFAVGDLLVLLEYDTEKRMSTGREVHATVGYLLKGEPYLPKDTVCMQLIKTERVFVTD